MFGDDTFGYSVDPNAYVDKILKELPKLENVDAKIVLTSFYETHYGVYNHFTGFNNRVLSVVGYHECENTVDYSLLDDAIDSYSKFSIKEYFGLSLSEYLGLTRAVIETLHKGSERIAERKNAALTAAQKTFDQSLNI